MTLLEIRTKFAQLSGRYDLVNPNTFADNGADFYINAGMRFLERSIGWAKDTKIDDTTFTAGDYEVELTDCRSVLNVWSIDSDGDKTQLEKLDWIDFQEEYGETYSTVTQGTPKHYAIALEGEIATVGDDEKGLIILPPADGSYTIRVVGKFYASELSADGDTNWWTVNHPFLLVKAALYQLECAYRNTEGQADWLASIQIDLMAIDAEQVAEDNAEVDNMEG